MKVEGTTAAGQVRCEVRCRRRGYRNVRRRAGDPSAGAGIRGLERIRARTVEACTRTVPWYSASERSHRELPRVHPLTGIGRSIVSSAGASLSRYPSKPDPGDGSLGEVLPFRANRGIRRLRAYVRHTRGYAMAIRARKYAFLRTGPMRSVRSCELDGDTGAGEPLRAYGIVSVVRDLRYSRIGGAHRSWWQP